VKNPLDSPAAPFVLIPCKTCIIDWWSKMVMGVMNSWIRRAPNYKMDKGLLLLSFIIAVVAFLYAKELRLKEEKQFVTPGVYLEKQGDKHEN
jgi:hypothetical protein